MVIGIPSPEIKLQIIKQNSQLLLVWTTTVVSDKLWSVIVGGGGVNLYFYHLEPPLMCLAWKIPITSGREVNKKGAFLKISFTSVLKT